MDALVAIISCIVFCIVFTEAVPPEACFQNFRWDDCGQPPTPVMYYWKPGSRCEVGIWRGCLPSLNMFKSEYECISTCIFTITPKPENWHELQKEEEIDDYVTEAEMTTLGSGDEGSASGDEPSGSGENATETEDAGSGEASGDEGSAASGDTPGEGTEEGAAAEEVTEGA